MAEKVTAVFDIGKTNKKFFLFDEELNEITHQYINFEEIPDDDGFPSENLSSLEQWIKECVYGLIADARYELNKINFSTYGASLVHLNENGQKTAPFYNYLKPLEDEVLNSFFEKHGDRNIFSSVTSSPVMGLLNSGFQLYFLKHFKPHHFKNIKYSLHFPQYLSYLFTGRLCSDYTSIGCHTGLWDFHKGEYHEWLTVEGLRHLLAPVFLSGHSFKADINNKIIDVGIGVHDSSSALVPYIQSSKDPFILISTGTWSICMNYFNEDELTVEELEKDCLNFLSAKGSYIKASRLFLGKEISHQTCVLGEYFGRNSSGHERIKFNPLFKPGKREGKSLLFNYKHLSPGRFGFVNNDSPDFSIFSNYVEAYHYLMDEMTDLQVESLKLAVGNTQIKTIFLDGGFSSNEVFMQMLADKLPQYELLSSSFAKGTALGAAILVNDAKISLNFLRKNYDLKLTTAK